MKQEVAKSISVVFVLSILAKIIAFGKSMIQASYLGATVETDAYNMAYGLLDDALFLLTTSMAVAFVPLYMQKKQKHEESFIFSTRVITALSIFAVVFTLVMEICAPFIIRIIAPAYEGKLFWDTVAYFRIILLGFVFSLAVGMYQNILNSERIYGYANLSSIVNSVVLIIVTMLASKKYGIWSLVLSVPISYMCQFLVIYIKGRKYGHISLKYSLRDDTIKKLIVLVFPVFLSQASVEINQAVDRALLTSVEAGAVTSVSYAATLYQFTMHVINIPISTVMFTELSEASVKKDYDCMRGMLKDIYKIIFAVCLPVVVVVSFTSSEIVTIVFGRGKFDVYAISRTAAGLLGYIYCLIPVIIKNILTRAYYGLNDTRRPMIIGMLEVVTNILLSILMVKRWGIIGVVGATAIASLIFLIVLFVDFERTYFRVLRWKDIAGYWKEVIGGAGVFLVMWLIRNWIIVNVYVDFIIKSIVSFFVYFLILFAVREDMVIKVWAWMRKCIRKDINR